MLWRSKEDGKLRVKERSMAKGMDGVEICLEELVEEGEDVVVDIESEQGEQGSEGKAVSISSVTTAGYGFLDEIGDEEKDEELEQKNSENRKRKGREDNAQDGGKGRRKVEKTRDGREW